MRAGKHFHRQSSAAGWVRVAAILGIAVVLGASVIAVRAVEAVRQISSRRAGTSANQAAPSGGRTLGFVLSDMNVLFYREKNNGECSNGLVYTNWDNWLAQFPTAAARRAQLNRCGGVLERGPRCENVWFNPEAIKDPLPFREPTSKISYGVNLDGEMEGKATATTCAHEQFRSPDGTPGIDNQYYRFYGCEKNRQLETITGKKWISMTMSNRLLLEITGVDDERNDDSVEVSMYRGRDPLLHDADWNAVPWQSQRTELGPKSVLFRAHGKITDGVLTTEPIDAVWGDGELWERNSFIRGMKLRIELTPHGASVLRTGYMDADQIWEGYHAIAQGDFGASGPAAYSALHRLADGYKDPNTGVCTALSSARAFEFVPAHIIHSPEQVRP